MEHGILPVSYAGSDVELTPSEMAPATCPTSITYELSSISVWYRKYFSDQTALVGEAINITDDAPPSALNPANTDVFEHAEAVHLLQNVAVRTLHT